MSTPPFDDSQHPREQSGQFATKPVLDAAGGMDALGTQAAAAAEPLQFDRNHKNYDQVRPHFDDVMGRTRGTCDHRISDGNADDPSYAYCGFAVGHAGDHGDWQI